MQSTALVIIIALLLQSNLAEPPKEVKQVIKPPAYTRTVEKEPSRSRQTVYICTGYCSCHKCTGKHPEQRGYGVTASGETVSDNTVASSLPFGTVLHIQGLGTKIVQDRGVSGNRIDVWFPTHEQALEFGVKRLEVEEVE